MTLSVVWDQGMHYPGPADWYSPDAPYPEYRWDSVSPEPNPVYAGVRRVFEQAGLDRGRLGTPAWNPLGTFIRPGDTAFVLCNFVYHRRPQEDLARFWSKCIHGSVLRAVLDYVLLAVGPEGRVSFGNAPVQGASWADVLRETGASRVVDFYRFHAVDVSATDLRMVVSERDSLGRLLRQEHRTDDSVVEVDLGEKSLLAELDTRRGSPYRVDDYDPARTAAFQSSGRHTYLIHRKVLEADVVLSLPKLKTHEKVGITCGLKGFVGSVTDKTCLAHHRFGGPSAGGDEFRRDSYIRARLARLHDFVSAQTSTSFGVNLLRVVDRNARRVVTHTGGTSAGAWHGNDTAWRMAIDIARILMHADVDGDLHEDYRRRHLALVDGVIGGQGDGPLAPTPARRGILAFSDDVALLDWACALLMGFDPKQIPIVREAFRSDGLMMSGADPEASQIVLNGEEMSMYLVPRSGVTPFRPPRGWRGHIELDASGVA